MRSSPSPHHRLRRHVGALLVFLPVRPGSGPVLNQHERVIRRRGGQMSFGELIARHKANGTLGALLKSLAL